MTQTTGQCQAWIGLGQLCTTPPEPGKRFCTFHDSFAGPWSKAVLHDGSPGADRAGPTSRISRFWTWLKNLGWPK